MKLLRNSTTVRRFEQQPDSPPFLMAHSNEAANDCPPSRWNGRSCQKLLKVSERKNISLR